MTDFIYFLGRFHVLALHLPIGIIFAAIGLEWLTRGKRNQSLTIIAPFLWGLATVTSILTVVLGYMHFSEGGFDGDSADAHRFYGTSIAIITTLVWLCCVKWPSFYQRSKLIISLLLLILITLTGHYGGNLTHGSAYLVEYAPNTLRTLAGLNERRPPIENLTMADPYYDVIFPMLQQRCSSCHNNDKSRGQFNLTNYDTTLAGGESGIAIALKDANGSEIYQRITLPSEHDDYMPADGKTPLTENQVELIRWWINTGAQINVTFADNVFASTVTPKIETLLMAELKLNEIQTDVSTNTAKVIVDPLVMNSLYQAGFQVRQLTQSDPKVIVNPVSPGKKINIQQIDALVQAADHIIHLDLQGVGLDDQKIKQFDAFTQLTRLRLNNNNLTDEGIRSILTLPKLEYLNLYGNTTITDKSIEVIAAAASLKQLYLWQTSVTSDGIKQLQVLRPDLKIENGTRDQSK